MDQSPTQHNQELPLPEVSTGVGGASNELETNSNVISSETSRGEKITDAKSAVSQAQTDDSTKAIDDQTDYNVKLVNDNSAQQNSTNPVIADDVDVIEKEWVAKAKEIVARTKDDPSEQSNQLMYFRHDYMKKRYGKEIKLPNVPKAA